MSKLILVPGRLRATSGHGGRRAGAGRPNRAAAAAKRAAAASGIVTPGALGIDPATIDPRRILAQIAADAAVPASARVAACKALMADAAPKEPDDRDSMDPASTRAIAML